MAAILTARVIWDKGEGRNVPVDSDIEISEFFVCLTGQNMSH